MPISALVREQLSPPPRPLAGLSRLFFIICGHFDHGCLLRSSRRHCVYLQGRGKTRNEMFIPSGLKCLRSKSTGERTWNPGLQVKASVQARENDLLVQAIDTRAVRGNKSARQRGSKFTYHCW